MTQAFGVLSAPDTLTIERVLPGPIERIWRYLTESELRKKWLAAGNMDLRVGGQVELLFNNNSLTTPDDLPPEKHQCHAGEHGFKASVVACEPPHLLSYTWPMGDGEFSQVRFELSERGQQVLLLLTHSRLKKTSQILSVSGGWHAHLDILIAHLEGQTPPPFWATHSKLEAEYARRFGV